jgi:hypothetical protein
VLPTRGIAAVLLVVSKTLAAQTTLGFGALHGMLLDVSDRRVVGAKVSLTETSKGLVLNPAAMDPFSSFLCSPENIPFAWKCPGSPPNRWTA